MNDTESETRALLTRAATLEAARQRAHKAKDWPRVAGIERELACLWRRHADIEQQRKSA